MCTSTSLGSCCIASSVSTQLVGTGNVLLVQLVVVGVAGRGEAAPPSVGIGEDTLDGLALSIEGGGAGGAGAGASVGVFSIM